PVLNPSRAANSVNHLIIDRNADVTRKPSVTKESASAAGFFHQFRAGKIHIFRGDPWAKHRGKLLQDGACQLARCPHLVNLLRCLDWNHAKIRWLTSLKTDSRLDWHRRVLIYLVHGKSLSRELFCPCTPSSGAPHRSRKPIE